MKAIVLTRFGPPHVLQLEAVPKPQPTDDEVLSKVHATAVNDWDWSFMRGKPWGLRPILSETPQAVQYFGEGKHKGKIVIAVDSGARMAVA